MYRDSDFIASISKGFVGDDGVLLTGQNLRMRLKNQGDSQWQIDKTFSKKNPSSIKMLRVASGQTVTVGDVTFPVKAASKMKLVVEEGTYQVKKFALAETTEVEKGRKLTIADGKIVKISRF